MPTITQIKLIQKRNGNYLKYLLRNTVYGKYARDLSKIVNIFWGTTPARCKFLIKNYHVNKGKVGFLPNGVDETKINSYGLRNGQILLQNYNIVNDDFVVVSGGKFDNYKNIIPLVDSYEKLLKKYRNIKLVLFGSLSKDYYEYIQNKNIIYLGWLDGTSIINIMMNSNLSIFIGGHSTMWEESVALGLPGIFVRYPGFEHINFNDNLIFIDNNEENEIYKSLDLLLGNKDNYLKLKQNALSEERKQFYYSKIAKKAIGLLDC